jgi:hypothetical protein
MKSSLVALALVPLAAFAGAPPLTGLYAVGELGLVDFSMSDGKIVGRLRAGSVCSIPPDTQVVNGSFEGNVFVGTVMLCQDGPSCPAQRTYPMLGVHHGDGVASWIHLDPGCTSPALEEKKLVFRPATVDEKKALLGDNSAAAVALKGGKDPAAQAADALLEASRFMGDKKYAQAREKFRQAKEADDQRYEGFLGFGITEMKFSHPEQALESFEKALSVAQSHRATNSKLADIHYNRGCAFIAQNKKPEAIEALRLAVKLGGGLLADDFASDPDLNKLRADQDFKRLLGEVLVLSKKKPR